MKLKLSRAHTRFLGLTGTYQRPMDEELVPIGRVEVTPPVRAFLKGQLDAPGKHRGGPLYGYRRNGVIIALRAAFNGYTCWHGPDQGPLDMDERYLLGYLDGLLEQDDTPLPIDWVGNWLSYPDAELSSHLEDDLAWITRASETRLIDDEHCLLFVGRGEDGLAAHAYTQQAATGGTVILYHNLEGRQPPVLAP